VAVRVLTLNLWHDSGPWKERARRIREWIARLDPDLIGFQEVLRGPGVDLVAELVDERGPGAAPARVWHTEFVEAMRFWRDPALSFGNAVASRWPIVSRAELALPDRADGERRAALSVEIDAPLGRISFTCTHLNWKLHHGAARERQVVALADHVLRLRPKDGFPPVVVGDMNAEPDSDEIRFLQGLHSIDGRSVCLYDAWRVAGEGGPGFTWSNRNPYARSSLEPDRRIDYVLVGYPMLDGKGRIDACRVVCDDQRDGVWPSDHFGVYAELRTEPRPGEGLTG
jgi:endonuclease/exonuclease/phosphatase family metal-dependent hydrolase